jgi:hypothetical protein
MRLRLLKKSASLTLIHFRPDYARNWRSGDIVHVVLASPAPLKGPVTAADAPRRVKKLTGADHREQVADGPLGVKQRNRRARIETNH